MKKNTWFVILALAVLISLALPNGQAVAANLSAPQATSNHTIMFNGVVDTSTEWDLATEKLGAMSGVTYYATWDDTYLYVGMTGGSTTNDKYNLLIDVDPKDTGAGNSGTMNAYCGATFGADGKPDYAIQKYNGGVAFGNGTGGTWAGWTPAVETTALNGTNQVEFRVKWSDIGLGTRTSPVGLYLYVCNTDNLEWSAWPPTNPQWTGSVNELNTRTYFATTDAARSPRAYGVHLGDQTRFDATGTFDLLNGFAHVVVTAGGGAGCNFKVGVIGNRAADTNNSGVRRVYILEPTNCPGLTANITLKYLDGATLDAVDERNGYADDGTLKLYRWVAGTGWLPNGGLGTADDVNNNVTMTGISTFSTWAFGTGNGPTAVDLIDLNASVRPALGPTAAVAGLALAGLGLLGWQRRK